MDPPNVTEVKRSIAVIWETLQCPICLELLSEPVSTKCDHQFCKFCMLKLLDNTKLNRANCPVCKEKITKRSLQESPGFQRLVTGLQAMIHAYEHDTGTNYFTGLAQDGQKSCVTAGGKNIQVNDVNMVDVNVALPSSHSSTIAALNGFARVMGFEDSGHLTAESGIQDKVQTIESLDSVETKVKTSMHKTRGKGKKNQNSIPADSGPQRKSLRQKQKKDLQPEKSLLKKKRESVEKVAEWLMKVPAEGSLELEKSAENGNNLDNSGSSTSTLDVNVFNNNNNNNEENLKELPAKALEEQVFGATYKRERRTRPAVSLPGNVFTKPMPSETVKSAGKRHKKTSLTPTDFIKSSEEKPEKYLQEEPQSVTNDICMDLLEEAEKLDKLESDKTNCKAPSHVLQNRQPEQNLAKRLRSTGQAVDADLQAKAEMASSTPKKADKRKNNSGKRAPKPLVLVSGVQNEESLSKSKVPSEAVQVHIENYPSSEDQEVPVAMNTRRGRKLSLCSQKRGRKKDTSRLVLQTPEKGLSDPADGNACKSNGCIFEEDIGAIENIEINETASSRRPQHLVEEVSEASVDHDPLVFPSSINPTEDSALHQNHSAPEEKGEDNSEVDTEQLLKSFKATKRKSFHFGALNGKRSCSMYDNVIDLTSPTCSDFIPPTESQPTSGNKDTKISNEECFPALLSSSVSSALSPNKVAKCGTESSYVSVVPQVVDSGICFNAVEREEIPESLLESSARDDCRTLASENHSVELSQHLLNVESSLTPDGLLGPLHGSQPGVSQELSGQLSMHCNPRKSRRRRTQRLQSSSECESVSASNEELQTLTQIFEKSAPPAQGDCIQDVADTGGCEGDCVAERPPTCPSPDCVSASQGSVDLFDSPDKCDVQGNGTSLSAESSQLTSEVLVTQQKLEMKKELVRLEKLMALVSEVLQEKEANPAAPTCPDMPVIPCDQEANQDPDRETLAEGAQDGERVTRPNVSEHDGPAEMLVQEDKENKTPERDCSKAKMVMVSSGLAPAEQMTVKRFAKRVGARVVSQVTAEVTHIVMCTDEQLVCERTLKYFLGIAGRKWVVSFQWISECFKQKKLLDESKFEVRGDVVNGTHHLGPTRARTTDDDNLLMRGYEICFQGPFTDMTTDELEWMVQLCGAAVVKDPLLLDNKRKTNQLVIVQPGSAPCSTTYSSLSKQATVVTRGWLLDTVATYTLQTYANYQT
nr:breast cancer type 1 susceptibility protein homolog [Nerophis lumbriciformis]XP_061822666.1 breast cancer type 1 susceptibility protein homolog [Nerophis lumbriciformis]